MSKKLTEVSDQLTGVSEQLAEISKQLAADASLAQLATDTNFIAAIFGALVGGGISWLTQRAQFRREDHKIKLLQKDEDRATAQTLLSKLVSLDNTFTNFKREVEAARANYGEGEDLWTRYMPPVHSPERIPLDYRELHLLIKFKQFEILNEYQAGIVWLQNMIQSMDAYREMILDFQANVPAEMDGRTAGIVVNDNNRNQVMPKIVNLRVLSLSMETTITAQAVDLRELTKKYSDAMFEMVGHRPKVEFLDEFENPDQQPQ